MTIQELYDWAKKNNATGKKLVVNVICSDELYGGEYPIEAMRNFQPHTEGGKVIIMTVPWSHRKFQNP